MKFKQEAFEIIRKIKRINFTYRRLFIILLVSAIFLLYIGPIFVRWLFSRPAIDLKGNFFIFSKKTF